LALVSGIGIVVDIVTDDEVIYRCVFYDRGLYRIVDQRLQLSSQAFADRNQMPSVDRAALRGNDPTQTQKSPEDGVVSLLTGVVRQIDTVRQMDAKGKLITQYQINVIADPIVGQAHMSDNLAHAEIRPTPQYQNKSVFRKLQERLALLATQRIDQQGWEITPFDLGD
jgi:hypothetical protein